MPCFRCGGKKECGGDTLPPPKRVHSQSSTLSQASTIPIDYALGPFPGVPYNKQGALEGIQKAIHAFAGNLANENLQGYSLDTAKKIFQDKLDEWCDAPFNIDDEFTDFAVKIYRHAHQLRVEGRTIIDDSGYNGFISAVPVPSRFTPPTPSSSAPTGSKTSTRPKTKIPFGRSSKNDAKAEKKLCLPEGLELMEEECQALIEKASKQKGHDAEAE